MIAAALMLGACAQDVDTGDANIVRASESSLCAGVQVGWTPGTVPLDGTVQLTATGATCALGETAEYRYWYRQEGTGSSTYTLLQNWTTSTVSTNWNTETVPSGRYSLRAQARAVGTGVTADSSNVKATFVGDVCTSVTLSSAPSGTQPIGTELTFTAAATCVGSTPAQYKFARRPVGAPTYTDFTSWSTNPVATWDTDTDIAGQYNVIVYARSGTNLTVEAQRAITVRLGETCTSLTLVATPSVTAPVDSQVDLVATGSCTGSAMPEYQFRYRAVGAGTWSPLQGWSSTPTATWDTMLLGLPQGPYQLRVEVRGDDFAGPSQDATNLNITLGDYCGTAAITTSVPTPQPLGTAVGLIGTASCASGTPEYTFSYRLPGATSYSPVPPGTWGGNTATFQPTVSDPSGQYTLRVEVRAAGSAGAVQATATRNFNFGNICNGLTFVAVTPSPQALGTQVSLQSTASCTGGATAEYNLSYRLGGVGAWIPFPEGWTTSGSASWNTTGLTPGSYQLRSQTRALGNASAAETTRTLNFDLTCPAGYTATGGVCVDDDECALGTDTCGPGELCTNTPGGFTCDSCPAGSFSDGTVCTTVAQVSAGWDHSCATSASGALWCWGSNDYGQLGNNSTSSSNLPARVGSDTDWAGVATSFFFSCGVRTDGTLWCWGWNGAGQLGDGTSTDSLVPVQVGTDTDWASVDLGYYHSCGLRTDGTAWCWGWNGDGELGDGTTTDSPVPVQVGTDDDWASLSAGGYHNCGVRDDNSLWCWGWNATGEVGTGDTTQQNAPVQVGTDWASVACGGYHTCGVRSNGSLSCWGYNSSGALGDGTTTDHSTPTPVGSDNDWALVACGGEHTCGIRTTGTLWCWGHNDFGALGDGSVTMRLSPTQVGTNNGWTDVAAGDYFGGGVRGGLAYFWGDNSMGQLGDGTATSQNTPSISPNFQ